MTAHEARRAAAEQIATLFAEPGSPAWEGWVAALMAAFLIEPITRR